MKILLIILSIQLFSFIIENPIDRIGVKGPLEFNKTNFKLAWTDKPNDNYFIQEYLPDGEKPENFSQMITIHLFETDISVEEAVSQRIKQLEERKKTDPNCMFLVNESPDGKEMILDFMLGEHTEKNMMILVEFNIYRYKQINLGKNKKGIIVYAYSKRSYGDDITTFFKTFKDERIEFLNKMISTKIPKVSIDSK
jgi:hypothetical protein